MGQLKKAGVSAVHAHHLTQCEDVSSGKFRFGWFNMHLDYASLIIIEC